MKIVVNGILYDTESSEVCGISVPYRTTLYRRLDDGTFYLVTESKQICRSFYIDPESIKIKETSEITLHPMSDETARTWAEQNLSAETVYSLFGE